MMRKCSIVFLFSLLACGTACGQFIGYTSPQTVTSTPFPNPTTCTGAAQTANVPNLGQTVHQLTFTPITGVGSFTAKLQGSNDGVNFLDISDSSQGAPGSSTMQTLSVSGVYYAVVRVNVVCTASNTFAATYAGTSVTAGPFGGGPLVTQIDKQLTNGASAGSTITFPSLVPPFGNTGGQIQFAYLGGAGPSGSTITVNCGYTALPASTILTTAALVQTFNVAPGACSRVAVTYTSGGASANTYQLDYIFNSTGMLNPADPCTSAAKQSAFANITTATTTALVPAPTSAQARVYVCGIIAQLNSTTASTVLFEQGTGASCAGTPTALTATYTNSTIVSEPILVGNGSATVFSGAPGNGICAVTTVGTSPTIPTTISFVVE
jgi:hypothetical protein